MDENYREGPGIRPSSQQISNSIQSRPGVILSSQQTELRVDKIWQNLFIIFTGAILAFVLRSGYKDAPADVTHKHRINNMRNNLRDAEIEDIESGSKKYVASVYYMDIVNELEKMGDFIINISQDLERAFIHR